MPNGQESRVGRIAIGTLGIAVAGLMVTLIWQQFDSLRRDLRDHQNLPHHAAMGEQMAGVQQKLGQQDLKTADRFTRTDWHAAQKWIMYMFNHIDHRLEAIENRETSP